MSQIINRQQLGRKIRLAREDQKYTQFQLSCMIDVSPNFLGDVERGNKLPSLETLVKICNNLKLSMDYLLADSLQNFVSEESSVTYTDKQMAVLRDVVKSISNNF